MTTDRIIELAREHFADAKVAQTHTLMILFDELESFAQAIRRDALEEAAKIFDGYENAKGLAGVVNRTGVAIEIRALKEKK